jgi:Na+/melibiose symporter-like transporter
MILCYVNETIGAFFGGGGYINNVFTPNPNERTSLLVSSKFVAGLIEKLPQQIFGVLMDLIANNVIKIGLAKTFVAFKTVVWVWATLPTIMWYIMSKERVPQSEKAPNPIKGIFAIFRNKPLLINVLTDFVDGINVGTGEDLYYNDVLNFNLLPTVGGIAGSPISYASYAFVPKFRARFSTKTLFFMNRGSILISETAFFLFGLIGGKEKGLYLKRVPMTLIFAAGNVLEMTFYALGKVIGNEINFEVLDYFEWQNGYRLEATISLVRNYITKVKNIILNVINAKLLESWAGYQIGEDAIQTADTKWRLFIIAFGPRLIFDALSLIPMVFYNIDKNTRNKMYLDLEKMRAKRAQEELERVQLLDS